MAAAGKISAIFHRQKNLMMWGRFIEVLNQAAPSAELQEEAVHTANETFRHFGNVFTEEAVSAQ